MPFSAESRVFVEKSPAGVFRAALDGRILECNTSICRLLGYQSANEMRGVSFSALCWSQPEAEEFLSALHAAGLLTDIELCLRTTGNAPVWTLLSASLVEGKKPGEFVAVLVDITGRKLVETVPEAILQLDPQRRIVSVNRAGEKLFGFESAELLGRPLAVLIPEWSSGEDAAWNSRAAGGGVPVTQDARARRKDGAEFAADVRFSSEQADGGEVVCCSIHDASYRSRIARALRKSSHRIQNILESITDAFFALDRDWRFTYLNHRAEQMLARSRPELIGKCIWDQFPEMLGTPIDKHLHKVAETRAATEICLFFSPLSIWAEIHIYPSETGFSVYMQDITDRRELEDQFRQSQKLEALGRLAGGVAHDFDNLLTIIGGYGQMALESTSKKNPLHADLEAIVEAANRASALTRQLLTFSRRQVVQPKVLDANRLLARIYRMLCRVVGEHIDLRLALAPDAGRIKVDPGQLEQVVMNLAVNARDAMPNGGRITIESLNWKINERSRGVPLNFPSGPCVVLSVSDTGTGIDPEILSRIFEPFFTTKPKGKGTGLGLSTVYGIVKQSGGDLTVQSEVGKGTTFRLFFPQAGQSAEPPKTELRAPLTRGGTETILLVEDEPEVLKLASDMLSREGYTVLEAADGEHALGIWKAQSNQIDLLLTDVVMPRMGGRVLAEKLIATKPGFKVLYISGYSDDVIAEHGLSGDQFDFLQKPFTRESLSAKVRQVLDRASARASVSEPR